MESRRIKAFTLQEILIAMVIGTIVIGAAFYSYGVIQNAYETYRETTERSLEIKTMKTLLEEDFSNAEYVHKTSNGIQCMIDGNKVQYILNSEGIIRAILGWEESFNIPVTGVQSYFNHLETEDGQLIDELSFQSLDKDKVFYFHYSKIYGANRLMKPVSEIYD